MDVWLFITFTEHSCLTHQHKHMCLQKSWRFLMWGGKRRVPSSPKNVVWWPVPCDLAGIGKFRSTFGSEDPWDRWLCLIYKWINVQVEESGPGKSCDQRIWESTHRPGPLALSFCVRGPPGSWGRSSGPPSGGCRAPIDPPPRGKGSREDRCGGQTRDNA